MVRFGDIGFLRLLCWLGFMTLSDGTLLAASITLTTDRDEVALNETFQLVFTVRGEQTGEPDFSMLDRDFQLLGTSSSSQISMINGNTTRSKIYTLRVVPKKTGELVIPSITFGKDQSEPSRIRALESSRVVPGIPDVTDSMRIDVSVDVPNPYVQQQVLLTIKILRRINWQQASLSELDAGGNDLLAEQLGEDKHYSTMLEGKSWEVIERRFALFPQQSGEIEISPFMLTVSVADENRQGRRRSRDPFDSFFSRRPMVQKTARSDAIKLQVKPALEGVRPWLTATDLKLQETWSVDTRQLQVGESVTRTIAIIADGVSVGQLPQLKPAEVSGIKRYPDQPQTNEQATSHGLLSTSSQKFALIPAQAGEFEIPPLEVNWWNVSTDRMEIARLSGRTIKVSGVLATEIETTPTVPVPAVLQPLSEGESTAAPVVPVSRINDWLILSNIILAVLWLATLYAWWRGRKGRLRLPTVRSQSHLVRRELLRALDKSVAEQDGAASRDVILQLAKHIWPDEQPVSLAQVIRLSRGSLAEELNKLALSLYATGQTNWDGNLLVRELSALRPQKHKLRPQQTALEPMYPHRRPA